MNARRVALGFVAALAIVVGGVAIGWFGVTRFGSAGFIDIDQAQLQARLATRFPQKSCAMGLACATVGAPVVTLAEGSERIGLAADVLVALGRRQVPGKVAFSGVLRYVRYEGDFYLDDVHVDDFTLAGFPPELAEIVRARGPAAIQRALDGHPVYSIKSDSARTALAKLAVRDVRVVHGKLRISFVGAPD